MAQMGGRAGGGSHHVGQEFGLGLLSGKVLPASLTGACATVTELLRCPFGKYCRSACLPTLAAGPPQGEHLRVQAQGHRLFGGRHGGATAPDQFVATWRNGELIIAPIEAADTEYKEAA